MLTAQEALVAWRNGQRLLESLPRNSADYLALAEVVSGLESEYLRLRASLDEASAAATRLRRTLTKAYEVSGEGTRRD